MHDASVSVLLLGRAVKGDTQFGKFTGDLVDLADLAGGFVRHQLIFLVVTGRRSRRVAEFGGSGWGCSFLIFPFVNIPKKKKDDMVRSEGKKNPLQAKVQK